MAVYLLNLINLNVLMNLGNGMNYEISLPSANVNYPGPSKSMSFLFGCLWYYGDDSETSKLFAYDINNAFVFRISSSARMGSTINGFSTSR